MVGNSALSTPPPAGIDSRAAAGNDAAAAAATGGQAQVVNQLTLFPSGSIPPPAEPKRPASLVFSDMMDGISMLDRHFENEKRAIKIGAAILGILMGACGGFFGAHLGLADASVAIAVLFCIIAVVLVIFLAARAKEWVQLVAYKDWYAKHSPNPSEDLLSSEQLKAFEAFRKHHLGRKP